MSNLNRKKSKWITNLRQREYNNSMKSPAFQIK